MASSINLARLLQSTLVELEGSEDLKSNPEAAAELRGSILRTIAELEIARHRRSNAPNVQLMNTSEDSAAAPAATTDTKTAV